MKFEKLRQIDDLIRNGNGTEARKLLKQILKSKSFKKNRAQLAHFCVRTGMPHVGLRILQYKVRPGMKRASSATPSEIAEYAHCLIKVGAVEEGQQLLVELGEYSLPQVLLYKATAHIVHWNFAEAKPLLQQYLKLPRLSKYRRLVGQLNLAACHIFLDKPGRAILLIRDILHDSMYQKSSLIYANALELGAQAYIAQRKFEKAKSLLQVASERLKKAGTVDVLYVEKWRTLISFIQTRGKTKLDSVRRSALKFRHWETLRDLDRYESEVLNKKTLFLKLYFGTPHRSYRENLLKCRGKRILPSTFTYNMGRSRKIDLLNGKAGQLVIPKLTLRILRVLAKDLYAPTRLARLHSQLYPESIFHVSASPAKIYEGIRRARAWLQENNIPLTIHSDKNAYQLKGQCTLILPGDQVGADITLTVLERIQRLWPNEKFSAKQASKQLGISIRTLQRELDYLVTNKKITRLGKGPATRYRALAFVNREQKSSKAR